MKERFRNILGKGGRRWGAAALALTLLATLAAACAFGIRQEGGSALSQEELAKRCGVSRQTVNAIENNKYDPTLALAFRLAGELQVTVDQLFSP